MRRKLNCIEVAIRFIQVSPICWGRLATKCPRCCGHLSQADSYLVGLWAAELSRVWKERAPHLGSGKLSLDLRNVTYADTYGKQALRDICAFTDIELIANTPWTRNLAGEIVDNTRVCLSRENQPAGNAVAVCIRVNRASLMEPPSADTSRPAA